MEAIIIVSELFTPVNTRFQNKWIFKDFDKKKEATVNKPKLPDYL